MAHSDVSHSTSDFTVYVDALTFGGARASWRLCKSAAEATKRVLVLEPRPHSLAYRLAAQWLTSRGVAVESTEFFLGLLRDERGESLFRVARRKAARLAFAAAREVLGTAPVLEAINRDYPRDVVRLHLARHMWHPIETSLRCILVARALGGSSATVLIARPCDFPTSVLTDGSPGGSVHFHSNWRPIARRGSLIARLALVAALAWLRGVRARRVTRENNVSSASPSLLLSQDDDLVVDRSVRSQPFWLDPSAPAPFPVFVWQNNESLRVPPDVASLRALGVVAFGDAEAEALAARVPAVPVQSRLAKDRRQCLRLLLTTGDAALASSAYRLVRLFRRAHIATGVCAALSVRAFVAGEPNIPIVDAVNSVARELGVRTFGYQYSNIYFPSPLLLTTADEMLLFAPMYTRVWRHDGIASGQERAVGYPFGGAAGHVAPRASQLRARLEAAGATWVVAYFDESVQTSRYGQVHESDHLAELEMLARWVLQDQAAGVIVKTQFAYSRPSRRYSGSRDLAAAQATGRFVELAAGLHRNTIFPVEAALASDLSIGSAVGATAPVEAAVAGRRAVILNPYQCRGEWDDLYAEGDIVFRNLGSALSALEEHRRGRRPALGDWSGIAGRFDPFMDGKAGVRMAALFHAAVTRQHPLPLDPSNAHVS